MGKPKKKPPAGFDWMGLGRLVIQLATVTLSAVELWQRWQEWM